jgi:transcriptional regulator with XRE-family HTH domain
MKMEIEKIVLLTKEGRKYLKENRIKVIGSQRGIEKNKKFFQSIISDWERGKHNPSLLKLKEYLRILRIPIKSFLNNKKYTKGIKNLTYQIPSNLKKIRLSTSKAYILGVVGPGDGCVGRKELRLTSIDYDFIKEFSKQVREAYGLRPHVYFNKNHRIWYAVVSSKQVAEDVRSFNTSFREKDWKIPSEILFSDKQIKAAYLKGVFDSQGNVNFIENTRNVNLRSYNKSGLKQIQELLLALMIKSSLSDKGRRLYIYGKDDIENFAKNINFSIKRKTNLLKNLLKSYKRHKTSPKIVQVLLPEMKKLKEIGLSYHEIARVINKNQNTSISWTTFQNRLKNFGE